jgi:hypothetical protein
MYGIVMVELAQNGQRNPLAIQQDDRSGAKHRTRNTWSRDAVIAAFLIYGNL